MNAIAHIMGLTGLAVADPSTENIREICPCYRSRLVSLMLLFVRLQTEPRLWNKKYFLQNDSY